MVTASARSLPAGAIAFPAISRIARAQTYPARPVRIIVPYVAGASSDIIARLFAQALSERLGQQFAVFEGSLGGKWLGLLLEIAPGLKRAAIMFNPETAPASVYMPSIEIAARSLKVMTIIAPVHDEGDIETAIVSLGREPGGGLVVTADAFVIAHRAPIILAAARNNLPAVYIASDFVRDGGLLSYAPDLVDNFRRPPLLWIAFYAARSRAISRCSFRRNTRCP
jgi:putative ABC transport system substrate-binding protein